MKLNFETWVCVFTLLVQVQILMACGCVDFWTTTSLLLFRMWEPPESNGVLLSNHRHEQELQVVSGDCATKKVCFIHSEFFQFHFHFFFLNYVLWFWNLCGCFWMCHMQPVQDEDVMSKVYKTHEAIQWVLRGTCSFLVRLACMLQLKCLVNDWCLLFFGGVSDL